MPKKPRCPECDSKYVRKMHKSDAINRDIQHAREEVASDGFREVMIAFFMPKLTLPWECCKCGHVWDPSGGRMGRSFMVFLCATGVLVGLACIVGAYVAQARGDVAIPVAVIAMSMMSLVVSASWIGLKKYWNMEK